ncbi:MAG TPA: hypothetical protein VI583_04825 [Cyclobacteriaceae bacterium]|nr:hypothetical protein [Cyclobacteriaceae bacterium]
MGILLTVFQSLHGHRFNGSCIKARNPFLAAIFYLFFPAAGNAQSPENYPPIFLDNALMEAEIRSDFDAILSDRDDDPMNHDAMFSYIGPGGDTITIPTRLRVRGVFRRDPKNCSFPPLWVNFKKEDIKGTLFENQDRLKLVTPCQFERYVLQEYMIYKMYNLVSEMSYRVRLVRVKYFNTAKNKLLFTRLSFFIEDNDIMAARNGERNVTEKFHNPYKVDREQMIKAGLFEYMVGNKDWYITSRHNITLIWKDSLEAPYPVPYDFDMSGLIDAEYRKPAGVPEELLIDTQVYQGICMTEEEKKAAFGFFENLRDDFELTITEIPDAPRSLKNQTINYLKRFFDIINDPERVKSEIDMRCDKFQNYKY